VISIKYLFRGFIIFLILTLISACSGKGEEVVKIKDKRFSGLLIIQKVEDNTSSEEMQKMIRDKQNIEKILTMVEGLKVKVTDAQKVSEAMKSQDSYSFGFMEGDKFKPGRSPYTFIALNDGTFIFTNEDVNSMQIPRMTIGKHKKLLNEMKLLLEIGF
jgi:3-deoxy-D-arabino-heptulosonate 7-phosphate (DAHP) synthase